MGYKWLPSLVAVMPKIYFCCMRIVVGAGLLCLLQACGHNGDGGPSSSVEPAQGQSSSAGQAAATQLTVLDVAFADSGLLAPLVVTANEAITAVSWRQVAGPSTTVIDADQQSAWVLMPFAAGDGQVPMLFEVTATLASGVQLTAEQRIVLMPMTPQVAIAERWLTSQDAVVNLSANFQHAVFGNAGSGSSVGNGQLPPDPNTPPVNQPLTLPIIWRTEPATLAEVLPNPPTEISFNPSRQAELSLPLAIEPLPASSNAPAQTITLQFDIVLPSGERTPISMFVKQPTDAPIASSASSVVSSMSTSTISSLSSAITNASSSLNTATSSAAASESSAAVSSASSAPDARELAIAAICDISWQGLGALPSSHANYQTESPYINAEPFIDPVYVQHIEQSQQLEAGNPALVAAMEMLKSQPTGVWLDTEAGLCASVNGKPSLVDYLNLAEARDQLLTLVLYNIPARDCVRQERPGDFDATEQGLVDYETFVDRFSALANLYPDVAIATVVEPTAFASTVSNGGVAISGCYAARQLQLHEQSLDYALKRLAGSANIFTYLDYGDPAWPGSYSGEQALFELLASSQLSDGSLAVEGISLNVGSYVPLDEPFMLAQDNSGEPYALPKGAHSVNAHRKFLVDFLMAQMGIELPMLIDTGRNGWGGELRPDFKAVGQESRIDRRVGREAWCNAWLAGLGSNYQVGGSVSHLWVDPPGISDGARRADCNENFNKVVHRPKLGAPSAGEWFHEYFVDLIHNAYPPLIASLAQEPALPLAVSVAPTQIPVQSATNVQMMLQLPSDVSFTSLSLRYAGEDISLSEGWLGQNTATFSLGIIPLTYFQDVLKIAAVGTDGIRYYQEVAVFDSPEFDGKPIMDIALGGRGFFPDFYQIYQADLPEYIYTNNGFEGDDFLWVANFGDTAANGGDGHDFVQARNCAGGNGNDVLAAWGHASGDGGEDTFYAWDVNVTVDDTPHDYDIVYWLGRNFTEVNQQNTYEFMADGDDLIAVEHRTDAENGVLTVKGFFADPPHINEVHYGDGQVLTPDTAREMLGIGE